MNFYTLKTQADVDTANRESPKIIGEWKIGDTMAVSPRPDVSDTPRESAD